MSDNRLERSFKSEALARCFPVIRKVVSELSNVSEPTITADTSIFGLGISSIEAIQVAKVCRQQSINVQLRDVMQGILLGRICELTYEREYDSQHDESKQPKSWSDDMETKRIVVAAQLEHQVDDIQAVLPTLAGQEYHLRSWLASGRTLYEPAWVMRACERLDPDRLKRAWNELRRRRDILRTTFVATSPSETWQAVIRADRLRTETFATFERMDIDVLSAARDLARKEAHAPSDLLTPPVRLRHAKASNGDVVAVIVHHTLYDAWSMPRLIEDLAALYTGNKLPAPIAFADQVRPILESFLRTDAEDYWRNELHGASNTLLRPSEDCASVDDQSQCFVMIKSDSIVEDLEKRSQTLGATLPQCIVAAFARLIALETKATSPVFGLFEHGRLSQASDDAINGPCVNLLPFAPHDCTSHASKDLLRAVQRNLGQRVPFEQSRLSEVLEWADLDRLPFNTHLNLVWPTEINTNDKANALFEPLPIGVPTDFSSKTAIPGATPVDRLDVSMFNDGNVCVDVGPELGTGRLVFGVRADARLMMESAIEGFIGRLETAILELVAQ